MAAIHESGSRVSTLPWTVFFIAFALCLAPVFVVGGFRDGFTYWNALPVVAVFVALAVFGFSPAPGAFATVAIGLTELLHFAWMGDWGGTATGSSTSALVFIFMPFWSIVLGLVGAVIAWFVSRSFHQRTTRHSFHRHLE